MGIERDVEYARDAAVTAWVVAVCALLDAPSFWVDYNPYWGYELQDRKVFRSKPCQIEYPHAIEFTLADYLTVVP